MVFQKHPLFFTLGLNDSVPSLHAHPQTYPKVWIYHCLYLHLLVIIIMDGDAELKITTKFVCFSEVENQTFFTVI